MADVTMPQLGETVTEGTITRWFKSVGDQIAEDEVLFEVSTDKVDSEVPSPASGYLAEIKVQEGETVDVGTTLAVITSDAPSGGDGQAPAAPAAEPAAAEPQEAEQPAAEPEPEVATQGAAEPSGEAGATEAPAAEPPAPEPAAAPADQAPAGAPGDQAPAPPERQRAEGPSRLLSPVVRRLIAEHDLDPSTIEGTGAGGRITRSDVLAVVEGRGGSRPAPAAAPPAAEAPAAEAPAAKAPEAKAPEAPARPPAEPAPVRAPAAEAGERDEVVPFTNIRRRTAEHMVRSKATSAHTLVVIEVDYENVDRVRVPAKDGFRAEEGVGLTYLPFVSRAVVDSIREFPRVNASVGDDALVVHHDIHLGIAVDLDLEGLMVPVVHGADGKRLRALAREIADLAARARSKRLGPDDIAGGTFTITNPGPFGTLMTAAVINQPQIAILSTDGVKKRPVAVEFPDGTDAVAVHPTGNLALSFDHRAIDGAYASSFLAKVKEVLETRDWSAELS